MASSAKRAVSGGKPKVGAGVAGRHAKGRRKPARCHSKTSALLSAAATTSSTTYTMRKSCPLRLRRMRSCPIRAPDIRQMRAKMRVVRPQFES